MSDTVTARRVQPSRERRASAIKRRASSPIPPPTHDQNPSTPSTRAATSIANTDGKPKRYEKRIKTVHISTPSRETSTIGSSLEEALPTKIVNSRPLPCLNDKQPDNLPTLQYQSIAESATLSASLHRSRMQWLCEGIFKKYWVKPVRRKKIIEEPPNNPDVKSMHSLGTANITIEPHTFEARFFVVREAVPMPLPLVKPAPALPLNTAKPVVTPSPSLQTPAKSIPPISQPLVTAQTPTARLPTTPNSSQTKPVPPKLPTTAVRPPPVTQTQNISKPLLPPTSTQTPTRTATPPAAKTTDPVIQMLASKAAVDPHLKELMKIVAASQATPEQLREFQKHIDGFNAIVKKQESEREARAKLAAATGTAHPLLSTHSLHYGIARSSPLNPQFTPHQNFPRPEPRIKHIIIEFLSPPSAGQAPITDRWLFPEHAVLDTQYGGTEMTCSFLVERKGSEILAAFKDVSPEELLSMKQIWRPDTEYFQPVTFTIKTSQHRILETIARSAKSLPEVQKHMQHILENKTRAPQLYLVHQLAKEKVEHAVEFIDSGVDMDDEDVLKDFYPI